MGDLNKDSMEQEIQDYFTEIYSKEKEYFSIDEIDLLLMDLPKPSWDDIEAEADRIMKEELTEGAETEKERKNKPISIRPKKKLMVAILAATIGTLALAGVANGDRMYQYVISQEWKGGEHNYIVDSDKIHKNRENPYEDMVIDILQETGVQSIQPMDLSWNLTSYEIEGEYSYLTFEKDNVELHVKQRYYQDKEISIMRTTDKKYIGSETNELLPSVEFPIYYEKTKTGESYETIFTFGDSLYVIRGICNESDIKDFIKEIYIKHTLD